MMPTATSASPTSSPARCALPARSPPASSRSTAYSPTSRTTKGLRAEAEAARREGFTGKLAIHPAQVPIINAAFTPSRRRSAPRRSNRRRVRGTARRRRAVGRRQNGRSPAPRAGQARTGTSTIGGLHGDDRRTNHRDTEATTGPTTAKGWGTDAPDQPLRPMEFERRALRPDDVAIKITYAGICHSDLHTCRNDWGGTRYPVIPGHEIVGTVTAVGNEVTRHRVGDTVAVGCMVDSCMECDQCLEGWEVFCRKGCIQTYNSADYHDGTISKGGYTDHIVVRDHFVLQGARQAWT